MLARFTRVFVRPSGTRTAVSTGGALRQQVCEGESVALGRLAETHGEWRIEHRTRMAEGVELAAFAARIDARWQAGQKRRIKLPPDEGRVKLLRIDTGQSCPQSLLNHGPGQSRRVGGRPPQGKPRHQPRIGQLPLAIGPDVL